MNTDFLWGFRVPVGGQETTGTVWWGHRGPGWGASSFAGVSIGWGTLLSPLLLAAGSARRGPLQLVRLSAPSLVLRCQPHPLLPPCPPGTSSWWPSLLLLTLLSLVAIAAQSSCSNAQHWDDSGWNLLLASPDG